MVRVSGRGSVAGYYHSSGATTKVTSSAREAIGDDDVLSLSLSLSLSRSSAKNLMRKVNTRAAAEIKA